MRFPFFRSKPAAPGAPPEWRRGKPANDETTTVEAARTRARRRLVGALVLLVIGIIGFPVLFETQPRPLPVDTPIDTPRRDTGVVAQSEPAPVVAPLPVDGGKDTLPTPGPVAAPPESTVAAVEIAAAPSAPAAPVATAPPRPEPPKPTPVREATPAPAKPAPAPPPVQTAAATPTATPASANGRFVVQVGAYTDSATLREARAKVEKLGLKTYTQVIQSDAGPRTRVRLGPFATREDADAAASKVKRAGLPAAILAL